MNVFTSFALIFYEALDRDKIYSGGIYKGFESYLSGRFEREYHI